MKRPLLLAHRGFSGNYPENSPLAFRMAVEKTAADGFESDVHITKDGKLVIFHDASVERTSNGTGFIKNMTYDELLSLDIGAWKSPEFAGQHIWTFGQLLDFCKETKMLLNMELKNYEVFYENLEQRVIDEICKRQMQEQVFVSSFNHISMQHFKELCPDIETGLLYDKPYRRIHVHDRGSPAAFASQIQLAAVLPAAAQPGHLPAAGAAEVWSQPRNGRLLSVGLLPGILFRRLFLRRLENIRFHQYGVSPLTGVTGIFQKALYFMLVPERHFPAIRNTLPVQGVRDGLIGSSGVVERKDHADGSLFLRHDLQRAVSDLIPV